MKIRELLTKFIKEARLSDDKGDTQGPSKKHRGG